MKRLLQNLPPTLLLSLGLNAILVSVLLINWRHGAAPVQQPIGKMVVSPQPKVAAPAKPAAIAKPFQWSQIETPDFATYVKNLRAIGCPELTIRDIVAGELTEIYAQKRQDITATTSGRLQEAEMMKLQSEHDQLLTHLTAPAASSTQVNAVPASVATQSGGSSTVTSTRTNATSISVRNPAADIPAAFSYGTTGAVVAQQGSQAVLNSSTPNQTLSPAATTALQRMQNDFVQALGDTVQNPDSPAYRTRWNLARRDSDEQFSSMFGGDVFIRTQIEAAHAGTSAAAK